MEYTEEYVLEQEKTLVVPSFTHEDAWELGMLARSIAISRGLKVAICVEHSNQVVFQCGLPGTSPDNDRWMAGKRNIARITHHSSLFKRLRMEKLGGSPEAAFFMDNQEYICSGGCVPVSVPNVGVVGLMTVSGMPDTEDHALSVEAVQRFAKGERA